MIIDCSCNIALGWLAAGISLNCAAKLLKNKSIWEGAACCCGLLLLPIFITILCSALLAELIADDILSSATGRRLLVARLLGLLSVPELDGVAMDGVSPRSQNGLSSESDTGLSDVSSAEFSLSGGAGLSAYMKTFNANILTTQYHGRAAEYIHFLFLVKSNH